MGPCCEQGIVVLEEHGKSDEGRFCREVGIRAHVSPRRTHRVGTKQGNRGLHRKHILPRMQAEAGWSIFKE